MRSFLTRVSASLLAVVCLAAVKSAAALAAAAFLSAPVRYGPAAFPLAVNVVNIAVFGTVGLWLLLGSHQDDRAKYLGALYLVIGAMFGDRPLTYAIDGTTAAARALAFVWALDPVAFSPWLLWRFAEQFPREVPLDRWQQVAARISRFCGWAGLVLFAISVAAAFSVASAEASRVPVVLPRELRAYWILLIVGVLGALLLIVRNTRAARADEQRRARLFVAGLILGFVPMAGDVLLEFAIPSFGAWMNRPDVRPWSGLIFYPLLLSVPLTTGYAVVVDQVLSVRLVVRRAIRYALARASIVGLLVVPFAISLWYLYSHRNEPVRALLQGPRPLVLGALLGVGATLLLLRRELLTGLDRHFFREQYDAQVILRELIDESRTATSVERLATRIERELDRALHLDTVALFVATIDGTRLVSPHAGLLDLPSDSALAVLLGGSDDPLDVVLDHRRSALSRLPAAERRWLVEGGFRLLVPIREGDPAALRGLIALGSKRSELPFSSDDRALLASVAASAAVVMENLRLRTPHDSSPRDAGDAHVARDLEPALAMECTRCFMVQPADRSVCRSCGGPLTAAPVPLVLRGVFRIESRIGTGGMGVVYRATDLNLGRTVAIKTLPEVSAERVNRMRREARTMAALNHHHLATIYAIEVWRNTPLLVVEYFDAGTLADRLRSGALPIRASLEIGEAVASGLERVHAAGILHRDVKPSNIAFTAAGVPKLLDFGLAKLTGRADVLDPGFLAADSTTELTGKTALSSLTDSRRMIGTPLYLSPEGVAMQPPDSGVDLWALAMVLYECIAGTHPMKAVTVFETMARIARADVPDIRGACPACPAAVAEFLGAALHRDRRHRPDSAHQMRTRLAGLLRDLP